jgi:hypothetical protein
MTRNDQNRDNWLHVSCEQMGWKIFWEQLPSHDSRKTSYGNAYLFYGMFIHPVVSFPTNQLKYMTSGAGCSKLG